MTFPAWLKNQLKTAKTFEEDPKADSAARAAARIERVTYERALQQLEETSPNQDLDRGLNPSKQGGDADHRCDRNRRRPHLTGGGLGDGSAPETSEVRVAIEKLAEEAEQRASFTSGLPLRTRGDEEMRRAGLAEALEVIHELAEVGDGTGAGTCGDRHGDSSEQSTAEVLASSTSAPPASADSVTASTQQGGELRAIAVAFLDRAFTDRQEILKQLGIECPTDFHQFDALAEVRRRGRILQLAEKLGMASPVQEAPGCGVEEGGVERG